MIIRLNVEADDYADLVMEDGFWPKDIICRPWLSRGSLRKRADTNRRVINYANLRDVDRCSNSCVDSNPFESLSSDVD